MAAKTTKKAKKGNGKFFLGATLGAAAGAVAGFFAIKNKDKIKKGVKAAEEKITCKKACEKKPAAKKSTAKKTTAKKTSK